MNNRQITANPLAQYWVTLMLLLAISGCSSSASVKINTTFPQVLAEPKPINVAILFNDSFSAYQARPTKNTHLDIGTAQVQLFKNAFKGLFSEIEFVATADSIGEQTSLVITPSVREVQISTPSDNYLNIFEVWIKYNLEIKTADGETLTNWFMPVYGKTPDSFMASKSAAIEHATITAIRDAGAKLILDFYRIPAVYDWVSKQRLKEDLG